MNNLIKLQLICGLMWIFLGVLIVIYLFMPSESFLIFIWSGFAAGSVLTGLWMVIEPLKR